MVRQRLCTTIAEYEPFDTIDAALAMASRVFRIDIADTWIECYGCVVVIYDELMKIFRGYDDNG